MAKNKRCNQRNVGLASGRSSHLLISFRGRLTGESPSGSPFISELWSEVVTLARVSLFTSEDKGKRDVAAAAGPFLMSRKGLFG